jgi:hypothetical protein
MDEPHSYRFRCFLSWRDVNVRPIAEDRANILEWIG